MLTSLLLVAALGGPASAEKDAGFKRVPADKIEPEVAPVLAKVKPLAFKLAVDDKTKEKEFVFVDGGVTMYNNPAFQMFLMATLDLFQIAQQLADPRISYLRHGFLIELPCLQFHHLGLLAHFGNFQRPG